MPAWLAPVLGAGASILGSYFGHKLSADSAKKSARADRELNEDFARNGVKMRVADAKAAGISPLAALAFQPPSVSPSMVGDTSMGGFVRDMGQDISRAVNATSTQSERVFRALALEKAGLENDILRSQLNRLNSPPPPPFPSPGGNNMGGMVDPQALRPTASSPFNSAQDVGAVADYAYARTPWGLTIVPGKDIKERIEDQIVPETMWALRNMLSPNLSISHPRPSPVEFPLPPGYTKWEWSVFRQGFVPAGRVRSFGKTSMGQGRSW